MLSDALTARNAIGRDRCAGRTASSRSTTTGRALDMERIVAWLAESYWAGAQPEAAVRTLLGRRPV